MNSKKKKGLSIKEGTDKVPLNINPRLKRKPMAVPISTEEYIKGVLAGDRIILSKAITLVESKLAKHLEMAEKILEACLPQSGKSFRLGITGSPGVGKSTFIENFGKNLLQQNKKVCILAVDPSSQFTKGSILGDKTRMEELSKSDKVFIRPSPASQTLGGVARKTRETIILCEAAGFENILIETVGVGQSEIAVHSMVDFFLLLLLPGGGDELQGIKRGVVEMADLIAVNKADGERLSLAKQAQRAYRNALHLFPAKKSGWIPKVVLCSSPDNLGFDQVEDHIKAYQELTRRNKHFLKNRSAQAKYWLDETIFQKLGQLFFENTRVKQHYPGIEKAVLEGKITPFKGAEELLKFFGQEK